MRSATKYIESSGNVFADLEFENPEEALAKSELAYQIAKLIKKKKLTQKQAAHVLGIDQSELSALVCGRLHGFFLDQLLRYLNKLGQDVCIMVCPSEPPSEMGKTRVQWSERSFPDQWSFVRRVEK